MTRHHRKGNWRTTRSRACASAAIVSAARRMRLGSVVEERVTSGYFGYSRFRDPHKTPIQTKST